MKFNRNCCHYVSVALFWCLFRSVLCDNLPEDKIFLQWSNVLEQKLHSFLATQILKSDFAIKAYTDLKDVELLKVNGTKIVDQVIQKASVLLKKKEKALQRLYETAREAESHHEEDLTLTLRHVPFFNVKGAEAEVDGALEYRDSFKQNVSLNMSGVHIPLEIYEGYPEILNGLRWSAALDKVFEKNLEDDETLRWQYFGSSRGFMRIFPALRWPENLNPPDLFDVRRRPWYIHSIASPKDVIILIDKSGSVHGQTIDIMKIAVKALIRTLSEDDYVNVAWFNNEVNWVVPCMDSLVPATSYNKRVLSDAVDRLHESNLTSYETALGFAYEAFQKFLETREPWEGASCHRAIMFFSDGGTEWPQELSSHLCNNTTQDCVRVFTFGCGPHPIPTVILKNMACNTRGYFSSITALGAIQNRIQDYVRILGRPLVLSDPETKHLFHWSNVYIDKGGLGPVITVTLPVSGSSVDARDPLLLGVVGTDIPTSDLKELFPHHMLGALGYCFAVNSNGFVVFHPQLHHHISYLQGEDPPNIDLLEAEGVETKEMEDFREAMVLGRRGDFHHRQAIVPVGLRRSVIVSRHFFYGPMKTSPFRFGVALPDGHVMMNVPGSVVNIDRLSKLRSVPGALLAPWKFCDGLPTDVDSEELINLLFSYLNQNHHKCNMGMLRHLLLDLETTRSTIVEWEKSELEFIGVVSRYVSTDGGLTIIRPVSRVADYERDRNPHTNHRYLRALARGHCVLTPKQGEEYLSAFTVHITCPLKHEKSGSSVFTGVVGAEVEHLMVKREFDQILEPFCSDNETLHCYLIDDGAFIIASNQPFVQPGDFLGQIDSQLTEDLVFYGDIFRVQERFNLQAWCLRGASEPIQSASTIPSIFALFNNMVKAVSSVHYFFLGVWASLWPAPSEAFFGWELLRRNYSCITKTAWLAEAGAGSQPGRAIECGGCSRRLHVAALPSLSATLVVAEPPCLCALAPTLWSVTPQEDVGPDYCDRRKLVRKRLHSCYGFNQKENGTSCYAGDFSGGGRLQRSFATMLLILVLQYFKREILWW